MEPNNILIQTRSVVYEFLPTAFLIHIISKLSRIDRQVLITKNKKAIESRAQLYIQVPTLKRYINEFLTQH